MQMLQILACNVPLKHMFVFGDARHLSMHINGDLRDTPKNKHNDHDYYYYQRYFFVGQPHTMPLRKYETNTRGQNLNQHHQIFCCFAFECLTVYRLCRMTIYGKPEIDIKNRSK